MNLRRASTFSPISGVKISSAATASSSLTCITVQMAAVELGGGGIVFLNITEEGGETSSFEVDAFLGLHDVIFRSAFHQFARELTIIADIPFRFVALTTIERRVGDIDMAALDEFFHV